MPEYDDVTAIAVGNNNVAGLTLVSSIVSDGRNLLAPFTPAAFSRGERRFKANGVPYVSGDQAKSWLSFMSLNQYTDIRDTYAGLVTVHGWLENTEEVNFNASLWFEEIGDYDPINVADEDIGWAVLAIKWNFTKVVVIPDA